MQHLDRGLLGVDLDDLVHINSLASESHLPQKRWDVLKARMQLATSFTCTAIGLLLIFAQVGEPLSHTLHPSMIAAIAYALLLAGVLLSHRYLRQCFSQSHYWSTACPACTENKLVRIPRLTRQRLASLVFALPFRNYACRNCPWHGTRIDRARL